jgi:hypothetical protein
MGKSKNFLVIAVVIVPTILASAIGGYWYRDWEAHHNVTMLGKPLELEHGTGPGGQPWKLVTQVQKNRLAKQQRRLCLTLYLRSNGPSASGCGFDAQGYWAEGLGPGRSVFYFGPVPATAVKVRLSGSGLRSYTVNTSPLPSFQGLPPGRYFIVDPDPDGSVTARSGGGWYVTPLDGNGKPVKFIPF